MAKSEAGLKTHNKKKQKWTLTKVKVKEAETN